MSACRLITGSRLHFGLLALGPQADRQFGGMGLMLRSPGLTIRAQPAPGWQFQGPLADRLRRVALQVSAGLGELGLPAGPAALTVEAAPPEHVGLGTGTQLGLSVARLLATLAGQPDLPLVELARLSGRGRRSGVGLHGFALGGLIVDGGRGPDGGPPPLLAHHAWPAEWSVLLVIPRLPAGLHGVAELNAFADLPPIPDAVTDRLARLVLLGLLPALAERDLTRFGVALTEMQVRVGEIFAQAQGGRFAHPELETLAGGLRSLGLHGVGQSSWGPTLYGFTDADAVARAALLDRIRAATHLPLELLAWTTGTDQGARLVSPQPHPVPERTRSS